MIPVLITGGAGYIGSHTAKALSRAGFYPVVLDNLSTGHRWAVKWGPLIEGDLADHKLIREVIGRFQVRAVVHFAASAYVTESMSNPGKYFRNNLANTLHLLDAMVDLNVRHMVFSSTCATYGIPEHLPITEEHRQHPINPYGESKLATERILHWYAKIHDLYWVALRYFNAAGADPDGELGEVHDPEPHLIPQAIRAALGELPHVNICGTDYPTADGTAIRDYVHVTDLAMAHVRALQHAMGHRTSRSLNLGTGKGHSVRQVISTVERVVGTRVPARETERRPGDPPILTADARRAGRILGWKPQYSELETIVRTALRWHAHGLKERIVTPAFVAKGVEARSLPA